MTRVLMPVFNEIDHDGRVERCASAVASMGHEVIVYALDSGKPYHPEGWQAVRVRVPGLGRLRMLRPFVFWAGFLLFALRARARARGGVVHAHDYFMAFPGWLAAKLLGARYVYDAHELIIPWPGVERPRFAMRVFYALERLVAGRADGIIAANAERARLMAEHYGLPRVPTLIQNIPQAESEDGDALARFPQLAREPGLFRLIYSGFISPAFGLGDYARAVDKLGPGHQLVLVGDGPDHAALAELAKTLRPGALVVLGRVPRRQLHGILRHADAGIIAYGKETLNEIHCAPNKVFEYARAGLPSLSNDNPGLVALLSRYGIGVSAAGAEDGVRAMLAEFPNCKAALPAFLAAESWENETARLKELYESIAL